MNNIKNKLNVKVTLLLSFGFFASTIAWTVYNAYVPLILDSFLKDFVNSSLLVGFVMTFDNIFGVIFQPLFGKLSDNTRTRFGRRMPYIFIGLPICAAAFILIPQMNNLWSLMIVLIIFTFIMSAWRSPVVALMPDLTPGPLRSQANGIVNLMGGIGAVFALLIGGMLFNFWKVKTCVCIDFDNCTEGHGFPLPFIMSACMMILALFVLAFFVREPPNAYLPVNSQTGEGKKGTDESPQEDKTKTVKVKLGKDERKSLILILFGIFFWFTGYNAVETFFTLYATNTLAMTAGDASMTLAIFSLTLVAFAVPAGFIGARIGRRKAILIGLSGLILFFLPMVFAANAWLTRICLFFCGISWAMVNVNSLPMIVRISGEEKIGTYIGYYYAFSFSAQVVSPALFGFIRDMVGHYQVLFLYAVIAFSLAMAALFFVRHGEDEPQVTNASEILNELGDG